MVGERQNGRTTELQNYRRTTEELQNYRTTELQNYYSVPQLLVHLLFFGWITNCIGHSSSDLPLSHHNFSHPRKPPTSQLTSRGPGAARVLPPPTKGKPVPLILCVRATPPNRSSRCFRIRANPPNLSSRRVALAQLASSPLLR